MPYYRAVYNGVKTHWRFIKEWEWMSEDDSLWFQRQIDKKLGYSLWDAVCEYFSKDKVSRDCINRFIFFLRYDAQDSLFDRFLKEIIFEENSKGTPVLGLVIEEENDEEKIQDELEREAEDEALEDWERGREAGWDEYEMIHYGGLQ